MANVDAMWLLAVDDGRSMLTSSCASLSRTTGEVVLAEFLRRDDCILVLDLDDCSEIAFAPARLGCAIATHKFGDPSVYTLLTGREPAPSMPSLVYRA